MIATAAEPGDLSRGEKAGNGLAIGIDQLPIQIGLAAAAVGFLLLFGSVIWERLEDREKEKGLIDEP